MDPKLKLAAEFAARNEHRSLSSYLESIVAAAVEALVIVRKHEDTVPVHLRSAFAVASEIYDPVPAHKFQNLARKFEELMSAEEVRLKKLTEMHRFDERYLLENWETLKRFASGNEPLHAFEA
jgi:hypothetical protein